VPVQPHPDEPPYLRLAPRAEPRARRGGTGVAPGTSPRVDDLDRVHVGFEPTEELHRAGAPTRDRPAPRWKVLFEPVRSAEPGTMPAGTALIIVVITLVGALVLTAGVIERKSAGRRPNHEARRSVAGGVHAVTGAFGLDAPAEALGDTVGPYIGHEKATSDASSTELSERARIENGAQTLPPPAGTPGDPAETPGPSTPSAAELAAKLTPKVRPATPDRPLKLWLGGDSMGIELGTGFARLAGETRLFDVTRDARASTGLTRPDFFNWPEHLLTNVVKADPDVVVILFGGNDDQNIPAWNGKPQAKAGTPEWQAEYRQRVADTMDLLKSKDDDRWVIWMGIPITRSGVMPNTEQMNYIYATEAAKRPWVEFVDAWPYFTDGSGAYTGSLPNADGQVRDMRNRDGIHLSTAGGNRLAYVLYQKLDGLIDLDAVPLAIDPSKAPPPEVSERPTVPPGPGSVPV
jgi:uncharacterized protein